jgi:hypothetical protein
MMSNADDFRRRSADLLRQACETADLNKRSQLIGLAASWHEKAVLFESSLPQP